jgi:hypothetical protein
MKFLTSLLCSAILVFTATAALAQGELKLVCDRVAQLRAADAAAVGDYPGASVEGIVNNLPAELRQVPALSVNDERVGEQLPTFDPSRGLRVMGCILLPAAVADAIFQSRCDKEFGNGTVANYFGGCENPK